MDNDSEARANIERFERAIVSGLHRSDVTVVKRNTVNASNPPDRCVDRACVQHLAADASATHVLTLDLDARGRDYTIDMALHDRNGVEVVRSQQTCDICGVEEVAALLEDQAAALRDKVLTLERPGRLLLTSEPRGADVLVDGHPVGSTPLQIEVEPGPHQITVRKEGFSPHTRTYDAVKGVEDRFALALRPEPRRPQADRLAAGGWAALAVGGSMSAAGATLLGLHHQPVGHRCTGDNVDDRGVCRWRFNSLPYGIPLAAAGVASVVTGVALLVTAKRRRGGSKRRARLHPTASGVSIQF